jgi:hypothetical protein
MPQQCPYTRSHAVSHHQFSLLPRIGNLARLDCDSFGATWHENKLAISQHPGQPVNISEGPRVGGGGGDVLTEITVVPEVLAPKEIKTGDSFLIGVKVTISDAKFVHRGAVDHGPLGGSRMA